MEFLVLERVLLQTLSFELQLVHPYSSGSTLLRELKHQIPKESLADIRQAMCNFLNDRCVSAFDGSCTLVALTMIVVIFAVCV